MNEYAFDIKLLGVARVKAQSLERAKRIVLAELDCVDLEMQTPEGVALTEAGIDGQPDLFEVNGEWVDD